MSASPKPLCLSQTVRLPGISGVILGQSGNDGSQQQYDHCRPKTEKASLDLGLHVAAKRIHHGRLPWQTGTAY
eukprot:m.132845 g.132845  ORF g.132845 m.132845 type:complete len:73 (-) comp23786_c0_seq3:627-845(-)